MYSDTRTGLVVIIGHLATVGAALVLLAVHLALGAFVRYRLGVADRERALWRWPVDAALGAGAMATLFFVVALLRALEPAVVRALVLAVAVVLHRELRALFAEVRVALYGGAHRTQAPEAGPTRWWAIPRALLIAFVFLLLAAALAPPTEWDSLMYHLRIPLWLLGQGHWAVPPDSFHVALVGVSHLATLPLLAVGLREGPAVMQVAAFALTIAGTMSLATRTGAGPAGRWIAVAALIGCPVFALVAITARVDVALVLTLLAAHLVLLEAAHKREAAGSPPSRDTTGLLLAGALLVGFAVAIKPQAGAYAIALAPLGWYAAKGRLRALGAATVAVLAAAPWFVKNLWLTGAPLYPKGAPGWFEPWLATVYGSRIRPEGFDASILGALPESRESFNLFAAFFDPGSLTIEGEGAFYALSPALLLLALLPFAARQRPRATLLLLTGLAYCAMVIVPFGQINLRYLMPAIPALAVALGVTSEWLADRASAQMRRFLLIAIAFAALLPLSGALRQRFLAPNVVLLRHAFGLASAQEVWRLHPDGTARGYAPVIANVQRRVPESGKVLMLWEARGLPLEREVVEDVMLSNWSFLAQSASPGRCLAGTGITHVLAGGGSVEYYVDRGANVNAFRLQEFGRFRERCLINHATVGPGFELFEVRATIP